MNDFRREICKFYQIDNSIPIQLCLYISEEWEDCFIALDFMNHLFILRSEPNEFKGEWTNRKDMVSLLYSNTFGQLKAKEIQKEELCGRLREFVEETK